MALLAALACLALPAPGAAAPDAGAPSKPAKPEMPKNMWIRPIAEDPGLMTWKTYRSATIKDEHAYLVYLPPGYEEEKKRRYPVIYWLHGRSGRIEAARWLVKHLDAAIREGKAPPVIVVSPRGRSGSSWLDRTDPTDGFLPAWTVFLKDFIPHVEKTYRAIPDRRARAIEGFSMGGGGAARFAFAHPELFVAVSSLGGALGSPGDRPAGAPPPQPEKLDPGQKARTPAEAAADEAMRRERSPARYLEKNADKIRGKLLIRIVVGADDDLLRASEGMHRRLDELKIPHTYTVVPGAGHNVEQLYAKYPGDPLEFWRKAFAELPSRTKVAGRKAR
jgi:enterochelin esterase-like enzyme